MFGIATLPSHRGQNLVSPCLEALEDKLLDLTPKDQELKFWLRIVEHVSGTYWRKKGYEQTSQEIQQSGTWGYEGAWVMGTLVKVIGMGRAG